MLDLGGNPLGHTSLPTAPISSRQPGLGEQTAVPQVSVAASWWEGAKTSDRKAQLTLHWGQKLLPSKQSKSLNELRAEEDDA